MEALISDGYFIDNEGIIRTSFQDIIVGFNDNSGRLLPLVIPDYYVG